MIFKSWLKFLSMTGDSSAILSRHWGLLEPHMDQVMDTLYDRLAQNEGAMGLFSGPLSKSNARERQRHYWASYIFVGNFDPPYEQSARAVAMTHFKLGVDLQIYTGAYQIVLEAVTEIVCQHLDGAELGAYLSALHRTVFLDMGVVSALYYESMLERQRSLANELNHALARAGEYRDNETGAHIMRMAKMCKALALAAGCEPPWAEMIEVAAPLHDVGKIGIPDKILLKQGQLTDSERTVMRHHPEIGGNIIPDHSSEVIQLARCISVTHHEKWDGSGYPSGLKGEAIPLAGRIAAICDVYDALVSERPYKKAWSNLAARQYLSEQSGQHFDPVLVRHFLDLAPAIDRIQGAYREPMDS